METFLIDFSPITEVVIALAAAVLSAVGAIAIAKLSAVLEARFGMQIEEAQRVKVQQALENAIAFAKIRAENFLEAKDDVQVRSAVLADAANYVIAKVPQGLDHLGINEEAVVDLLEARLSREFERVGIPA